MRSVFRLLPLCAALVAVGCTADGGFRNPFADEADQPAVSTAPVNPYFTGEFPDIPIPKEMKESSGSTFVTESQGMKTGTQTFSGQLEMVSLMNSMRRNMANDGWTLRSMQRAAKDSVLVFEKSNRIATLVFNDGMVFTDMRIFVSSRMNGDTGQYDTPSASGSKTVLSSDGVQPLQQ